MSDFGDRNAAQVHEFALQASNLGLSRLADLLVSMHQSGVWQGFTDGTGTYSFLPGEFDYFLTQQGISREQVMHGVRDVEAKAKLEAAMDERRTGEDGYRRRLEDVRSEVPDKPGRPIEPFGYTETQRKVLGSSAEGPKRREALGGTVRRWTRAGGKPAPVIRPPLAERVQRALARLSDEGLAEVVEAAKAEQRRRGKSAR